MQARKKYRPKKHVELFRKNILIHGNNSKVAHRCGNFSTTWCK